MFLLPCGGALRRLQILHLSLKKLRTLSSTAVSTPTPCPPEQPPPSSSIVHFLTTSCGLKAAHALSAARAFRCMDEKTRRQSESVLAVLQSQGFSQDQIAALVARCPRVLLCRAQQKLRPKLQFLARVGFSPEMITREPVVLLRSLDGHIRPSFDFFRCFLGSPEDVRTMFRHHKWCLNYNLKSTMIPNAGLLVELGVPAPAISKLMVAHPRTLMMKRDRFAEIVQTVQNWGLKPEKNLFSHAVRAISGMGKSTLAARLELFKNLGWSEEEVISAFRRGPLCLLVSDQKILCINSFARKLGLGSSDLSRNPKLLMYGFDKRILPRYGVWRMLTFRGLIKQSTAKLVTMIMTSEKLFFDRYVTRYINKVPELMDVYLGKIKVEVEGFDVGDEESRSRSHRENLCRSSQY